MVRNLRLLWTPQNEEHVARHGIDRDEVEEVARNAPLSNRGRHGTYRVVGQTDGGRYLTVIVAPQAGRGYYVVTARDADDVERRAYRRG